MLLPAKYQDKTLNCTTESPSKPLPAIVIFLSHMYTIHTADESAPLNKEP